MNTVVAALGVSAGPTLGGLITEQASWRWIFYLNVPLGVLDLLVTWRVLSNVGQRSPQSFDLAGAGLLAVSFSTLALGLSFAKADERKNASADTFGRDAAKAAALAESQAQSTALWCFVGGGAAAAFTLIFGLATRPAAKPPVKAGAFVGPQGSALFVEGQF